MRVDAALSGGTRTSSASQARCIACSRAPSTLTTRSASGRHASAVRSSKMPGDDTATRWINTPLNANAT
eukprot:1055684-Prymnesium_polylepis.1